MQHVPRYKRYNVDPAGQRPGRGDVRGAGRGGDVFGGGVMKQIWDKENIEIVRQLWQSKTPYEIADIINKRQDGKREIVSTLNLLGERKKKLKRPVRLTSDTAVFFQAIKLGLATHDELKDYKKWRQRNKVKAVCPICGHEWKTASRNLAMCSKCKVGSDENYV